MSIPLLAWLLPLFFAFEIWQLVLAERHVGVKQIKARSDPRTVGPSEPVACVWSLMIIVYWIWMITMMVPRFGRPQFICMLAVSMFGYSLRRTCGLQWLLVVLTLEGALRIGMLLSVGGLMWRRF